MKKYISYLISIWLLTTMLAACADETTNFIVQDEQGMLTLQLTSKTLATRAVIGTEAGEDAWNENAIKSVDCFFYPNGKTGDAAVFSATGIDVGATGTATVSIKIPNDKIEALFGTAGSTCQVYVIVNRPAASTLEEDTSISGLKKTVIEAEGFATQSNVVTAQDSFVMDGEQEITLSSDRKSITGSIDLYRVASKISLFITKVEKTVTDEAGNTWTSQPGNMKVFFHNGVKKAHVGVNADGSDYTIQPEDYFSFSLSGDTRGFEAVKAENGGTEYYKHAPFYSYSSDWNNDEEHEAYLTLVMPWKKEGESEFKSCYYQVPINVTNKKFERNNYYKIKLSVGILGDFNPDAPVELNPSYIIVDWGSGEVTANIKEYRYLVVDKNSVVMDNKDEISIPFLTSHEVEIVNEKMTKEDLSEEDVKIVVVDKSEYTLEVNNDVIYFKHTLNNDQHTDNYDHVPITLVFDVRHKDNYNFIEHITIEQYPAMYIIAVKNESSNNVFIYKNQGMNGSWDDLVNLSSGGNHNPNMYIINVSAFDDNNYIIGDTRSEKSISGVDADLDLTDEFNNKALTYYYPTRIDVSNFIAPKFRIASSRGKCNGSIGYEDAKKRCAAYQEYGYPAGRWRVPSEAELGYIAKLSSKSKIPHLFSDGKSYWTATGKSTYRNSGEITTSTTTGGDAFVRCVYDEWYWTDTVNKGTFTWGDKQR